MAKSSQMPDGGYQPVLGSNWMMDGFDFDSEYGDGPENARKDPELPRSQRGLATLPDGFLGTDPDEEFDFSIVEGGDERGFGDLSGMIREATPLMDLAWLEGAEQDPDRLPEAVNPIEYDLNDLYQTVLSDVEDTGTRSELEQAWGVNRRTDGQNIVPNIEYPRPATGPTSAIPGDQFREVVASAMRRSAFGENFREVISGSLALFGDRLEAAQKSPAFDKVAKAMRMIRAEHGLVGNVYVRDEAFPGLLSGKWDSAIKKRCASAQYFLTSPDSKLANFDNYLGKQVVTEIPWADALDHYRPTLEASGKRLASGDPRQILMAAFRQATPRVRRGTTTFPVNKTPTVSSHEAKTAFASAPIVERRVFAKDNTSLLKKAHVRLAHWVGAGLMSEGRAEMLKSQVSDPMDLLKTAALEISPAKRAEYVGSGIGAKVREAHRTRDAAWAGEKNEEIVKVARAKAEKVLNSLVKLGSITASDRTRLLASGLAPHDIIMFAKDRANDPFKTAELAPIESKDYAGAVFTPHSGATREASANPLEVRQMLRWASKQMSEGMAGKDLDYLLAARFSQDFLRLASEPLVSLRKKHEGLAGHLYVDASAYASTTGTEGCDKGALLHRANQLKAVLGMDRCESCSQNTSGSCQKYGKVIVSSAPVGDPTGYQRETIRLANSSDAEHTASLFAPTYNNEEYQLQNDSLDLIDYRETPEVDVLGDILFEGMILPDEE